MIRPILRVADARHAQHLIGLAAVALHQVAVRHDGLLFQLMADVLRRNEPQELLAVALRHIALGVVGKHVMEIEFLSLGKAVVDF